MANKAWDHVLEVKYRSTSGNGQTLRLGVDLDPGVLSLEERARLFVGSQLTVRAEYDPNAQGDTKGQGMLLKDDSGPAIVMEFVCEVHSLNLHPNKSAFTLVFPVTAVDASDLMTFPKKKGKLSLTLTGQGVTLDDEGSEEDG